MNDTHAVLDLIDHSIEHSSAGSPDAMRWNPDAADPSHTEQPSDQEWQVVSRYTRAAAIADGVLVAVPEKIAAELGFRFPIAMTAGTWADCVEWTDADRRRKNMPQDEEGRLWDVLWMTRCAIQGASRHTSRVTVQLSRVPRPGRGRTRLIHLTAVIGHGDAGEPVMTIMQPGED